jgi:hypothetical protein
LHSCGSHFHRRVTCWCSLMEQPEMQEPRWQTQFEKQ